MRTRIYSYWFILPGMVIYGLFFLFPVLVSFPFSFTRWTLTDWYFTGLDNFRMFFSEPSLRIGFTNTLLYAVLTSGLKTVLGFIFAAYLVGRPLGSGFLQSIIFFPSLISTVAVGVTFSSLMHPAFGLINKALTFVGIPGPDWLGDPHLALLSVSLVDVWRGVGMATVIYIAGIRSIPRSYYEAAMIDGATSGQRLLSITLPLSRPAMNTVILLSFIGGLRTFDLVWTMTRGGPGFSSDLIASIIYKQYQSGFYGLSTAGNVILFIFIALLAVPLNRVLSKAEVTL